MKALIMEDDFTGRLRLQDILKVDGPTYVAANGKEAVKAVRLELEAEEPYDMICLDIMMPAMRRPGGCEGSARWRALEGPIAPGLS